MFQLSLLSYKILYKINKSNKEPSITSVANNKTVWIRKYLWACYHNFAMCFKDELFKEFTFSYPTEGSLSKAGNLLHSCIALFLGCECIVQL